MTDPQDRPDAAAPAPPPETDETAEATPSGAAVAAEPDVAPAIEPAAAVPVATADEPAAPAVEPARRQRPQKKAPPPPRPLAPYAIIETGGKQYRVSVGDTLSVERLPAAAGADVTIDRVLLLGGNGAPRVGTPVVAGAAVTARVEDHFRGEKIVVFKYKAKKRYRRRLGHRQPLTRLTITGITGA